MQNLWEFSVLLLYIPLKYNPSHGNWQGERNLFSVLAFQRWASSSFWFAVSSPSFQVIFETSINPGSTFWKLRKQPLQFLTCPPTRNTQFGPAPCLLHILNISLNSLPAQQAPRAAATLRNGILSLPHLGGTSGQQQPEVLLLRIPAQSTPGPTGHVCVPAKRLSNIQISSCS